MLKRTILQRTCVLLKLSRRYLGRLLIASLLMVTGSVISLLLPMLTGRFIDALTLEAPAMSVPEVIVAMIIVMAVQGILLLSGGFIIAYADEHLFSDLRIQAFTHLHRLPLSFFSDRKQGELVSRIGSDVAEMSNAGPGNIVAILQGILTVLGATTMMLIISPKLFLWACIGVPLLLPILYVFSRKAYALSQVAQDQEAEICGYISDNVRNNALVKSFNAIDSEEARFTQIVSKAFKTAIRYNILTTLYRPATAIISFLATVVILVLGGHQVKYGYLQAGDIIAFLLLAGMLMASISHLASCFMTLVSAAGSASRLFDILDTPAEPTDRDELPRVDGNISLTDLTFGYTPDTQVIDGLSLTVPAGQTVAITGSSGSGKSTLLKLIAAFYSPQSGTITLDQHSIADYTPDSVRRQLAYLEQEPHLIYGTVRDNLTFGMPDATDEAVIAAAKAAQADGFICALPDGYDTVIGEDGVKLSTGQRHRLCLARAILKDAPILLLDEPGTALDTATAAALVESLRPALEAKTCLLVAHTGDLLALADTTVHLSSKIPQPSD